MPDTQEDQNSGKPSQLSLDNIDFLQKDKDQGKRQIRVLLIAEVIADPDHDPQIGTVDQGHKHENRILDDDLKTVVEVEGSHCHLDAVDC